MSFSSFAYFLLNCIYISYYSYLFTFKYLFYGFDRQVFSIIHLSEVFVHRLTFFEPRDYRVVFIIQKWRTAMLYAQKRSSTVAKQSHIFIQTRYAIIVHAFLSKDKNNTPHLDAIILLRLFGSFISALFEGICQIL